MRLEARPTPPLLDISSHRSRSGFHWDGSSRTFFEGWYFKITIPDRPGCSFAFIYAVEDPAGDTARSASSCQVMGPSDGYIVQWQPTVSDFWGSRHALELGYTFETRPGQRAPRGLMPGASRVVRNVP